MLRRDPGRQWNESGRRTRCAKRRTTMTWEESERWFASLCISGLPDDGVAVRDLVKFLEMSADMRELSTWEKQLWTPAVLRQNATVLFPLSWRSQHPHAKITKTQSRWQRQLHQHANEEPRPFRKPVRWHERSCAGRNGPVEFASAWPSSSWPGVRRAMATPGSSAVSVVHRISFGVPLVAGTETRPYCPGAIP
jgi:hypothetical protein